MKRILFMTHEDLKKTPVAKAMLGDVVDELSSYYECVLYSASSASDSFIEEKIRYIFFKRISLGKLGWFRNVFYFVQSLCAHFSLLKTCDIYFARSYPSALILALVGILTRKPLIFDTRGLFFHELFDSGKLKSRLAEPFLLRLEKWILARSKHVICVTDAQRDYYIRQNCAPQKLNVIYNCGKTVSSNLPELGKGKKYSIGYVGSLGLWHMMPLIRQIMGEIEKLSSEFEFHCVTHEVDKAKKIFSDLPNTKIYNHAYRDRPLQFTLGICLIKDSLSKSVCFPVKICEYLAAMTPIAFSDNLTVCNAINNKYTIGIPVDIGQPPEKIASNIVSIITANRLPKVELPDFLRFQTQISNIKAVIEGVLSAA